MYSELRKWALAGRTGEKREQTVSPLKICVS